MPTPRPTCASTESARRGNPRRPSLRAAAPGRGMRAAAAMRARTAANHPDHHMQADVTPPAREIGCGRGCGRPITRCGRALDAHEARGDRFQGLGHRCEWPNRPPCGIPAHCSSVQEGRGDRGEAPRHRRHAREARGRGRGAARRDPPPLLLVVTTLISINRYPYSIIGTLIPIIGTRRDPPPLLFVVTTLTLS